MKLAVSGKGGVGKTTFSALLIRTLDAQGKHVLAIDADPDANLAAAVEDPGCSHPIDPGTAVAERRIVNVTRQHHDRRVRGDPAGQVRIAEVAGAASARATAAPSGFPPNVEPCSPGMKKPRMALSARTAETG